MLLLHVSRLNADAMPEILAMMKRRAYRFAPLERVLADPAYSSPDNYYGRNGFSWIHRWSKTMGMAPRGEPGEPEAINAEFGSLGRR